MTSPLAAGLNVYFEMPEAWGKKKKNTLVFKGAFEFKKCGWDDLSK